MLLILCASLLLRVSITVSAHLTPRLKVSSLVDSGWIWNLEMLSEIYFEFLQAGQAGFLPWRYVVYGSCDWLDWTEQCNMWLFGLFAFGACRIRLDAREWTKWILMSTINMYNHTLFCLELEVHNRDKYLQKHNFFAASVFKCFQFFVLAASLCCSSSSRGGVCLWDKCIDL